MYISMEQKIFDKMADDWKVEKDEIYNQMERVSQEGNNGSKVSLDN